MLLFVTLLVGGSVAHHSGRFRYLNPVQMLVACGAPPSGFCFAQGVADNHLILWDASVKGVFFFNVPIPLRRSSFLMNVHNALCLQFDDVLMLCFLWGGNEFG